jgi:Family of unknown function (DUF5947)
MSVGSSRLARLARPPEPLPAVVEEEQCELCGDPIDQLHRHVLDLRERRLLCACRACVILLDRQGAGGRHFRLVPDTCRLVEGFYLDDVLWSRLRIPVDMAFFFRSTPAGRVLAFYPSPMGPTESLLELDAWAELEAANPALGELEPDVEALLVNRARGRREHWLVPIDDCYELVGVIRTRWKGLSGGEEVWEAIGRFFDDLATREERR